MMSLETKPQQYFVRIEINVIGTLMMLLYLPSLMPFYGQNFPHNFNFGSLLILLYFCSFQTVGGSSLIVFYEMLWTLIGFLNKDLKIQIMHFTRPTIPRFTFSSSSVTCGAGDCINLHDNWFESWLCCLHLRLVFFSFRLPPPLWYRITSHRSKANVICTIVEAKSA